MSDSDVKRIAARADLCRLLAACYYQPGPEFAEERVFDSMRVAAAEVDAGMASLVDALAQGFDAQPMEELQIDYTRLFLNPTGPLASPYESAWIAGRDPMLVEEVTQSVLDSYRAGGYDVDLSFRDLPDHIAAELEFLYALVFREARAAASGNGRGTRGGGRPATPFRRAAPRPVGRAVRDGAARTVARRRCTGHSPTSPSASWSPSGRSDGHAGFRGSMDPRSAA